MMAVDRVLGLIPDIFPYRTPAETGYSLNLIDLEEHGDATINLVSGTVQYNFTPDLMILKSHPVRRLVRLHRGQQPIAMEYRPGSKLFFVVNQGYVDEMTGLALQNFELVAKLGALFRFNGLLS